MSFTEKIDVLDLIIQTLKEHETKLDEITERLAIYTETLLSFSVEMGLNWPESKESYAR